MTIRIDGFTAFLMFIVLTIWLLILRRNEHSHDRNWTKEEYFQHIKEKHSDIWEEYLKEE